MNLYLFTRNAIFAVNSRNEGNGKTPRIKSEGGEGGVTDSEKSNNTSSKQNRLTSA